MLATCLNFILTKVDFLLSLSYFLNHYWLFIIDALLEVYSECRFPFNVVEWKVCYYQFKYYTYTVSSEKLRTEAFVIVTF